MLITKDVVDRFLDSSQKLLIVCLAFVTITAHLLYRGNTGQFSYLGNLKEKSLMNGVIMANGYFKEF